MPQTGPRTPEGKAHSSQNAVKHGFYSSALVVADEMLAEGVYVIAFSYPVVPQGHARVRCQISAAHTREHLEMALAAFKKVGKKLGVI